MNRTICAAALAALLPSIALFPLPCHSWQDPLSEVNRARIARDYITEKKLLEPLINGTQKRNPTAHLYWAWLMKREGKREEAIKHFHEAISLSDEQGWAYDESRRELPLIEAAPAMPASKRGGGRVGAIGLYYEDGIVKNVLPGSPAELAHVALGDKIVAVDDVSVTKLDDDAISNRIRGLEGMPVKLTIKRDGKLYACSIIRGIAVGQGPYGPAHVEPVSSSGHK